MFHSHKNCTEIALTIVRILVGITFTLHGAQKVLGLFGGMGLEKTVQWLASMNVPTWLAYFGCIVEFFAGLMVLIGCATELAAFMLVGFMAVAIYLVHWQHGYFIQNNGFEYGLNLMVLSIALIIGGPGTWAVWNPIKKYRVNS